MMETLAEELPSVRWEAPHPFKAIRMLPGGGAHCRGNAERFSAPLDFGRGIDELIVVSPFLDAHQPLALDRLAARTTGARHLFSRADSLDTLGEAALSGWQCYSLNEAIATGEERCQLQDAQAQDLHAKLFISRSGNTAHWHLGSANATNAALGAADGAVPRNTEFMLRLTSTNAAATPAALLDQWLNNPAGNLFSPHVFKALESVDPDGHEAAMQRLLHQLIAAKWTLRAVAHADARYTLTLTINGAIAIPEGFHVEVGLLCLPGRFAPLPPLPERQLTWPDLALTQISAFVPLRITGPTPDGASALVIQAGLQLPAGVDRSGAILRELVDTPEKLINYIRLLLYPDSSKEQWDAVDTSHTGRDDPDLFGFDLTSGIFEQLLQAASRRPEQLLRVRQLIVRMKKLDIPIPPAFLSLWRHFSTYTKEPN
jgi:hypothetical protein